MRLYKGKRFVTSSRSSERPRGTWPPIPCVPAAMNLKRFVRSTFQSLCFTGAVAAVLIGPAHSHAEVLALTHGDFSTTAQGAAGFQYGYYTDPDSTSAPFETTLMASAADGYGPYWAADLGGSYSPNLNRNSQHPGPEPALRPAVRRYTLGGAGEPSFSGSVRITGRYFDLNGGATNVFVAVDPDGDAGPAPRALVVPSTPLVGPQPVEFDVTVPNLLPNATIDFGVLAMGSFNSDSVGLAAFVVNGDTAVPSSLLANNYASANFVVGSPSQDARGLAFAQATNGVASDTDLETFTTEPGTASTYQFAGLLYRENAGSGNVTQFDSVRIDLTTSSEFAESPQLFLLRHNSDPSSINPAIDERYARLPVTATRVAENDAGQPYYTFDLTSLPAAQRTGFGFAVLGRGTGPSGSIAVSEISANATRVSDSGYVAAQPAWIQYGGHRYARTFTRGTWEQCQAEAVSYGGHLAAITDAGENAFIADAFRADTWLHIGLKRESGAFPAKWANGVDDFPGTYANWAPGNPGAPSEEFVAMNFAGDFGKWHDFPTQDAVNFSRGIIELPTVGDISNGRNYHVTVPGQANVFGAGGSLLDPAPAGFIGTAATPATGYAGLTGGVPAPSITVFGGETVRISSSGGSIFSGAEPSGPDGTHHATYRCDISGAGGISGYLNRNNSAHLVGVFLGNAQPAQMPARIDFSANGTGESFVSIAPELGQVFFIGDGLTSAGIPQQFIAPEGATRLFLGLPDAYQGNDTFIYTGAPNGYSDNSGTFAMRFAVTPSPAPRFLDSRFPASGTPLRIAGGQTPYSEVTVAAGSLPPGLSISDRTVLGRATEEGDFPVTLQVTDAANAVATQDFNLMVAGAPGDLVAWWTADQGAEDAAGTNHGAFSGNATIAAGGIVGGKAFLFDGADDIVTVPDADAFDLGGDFTIEVWVKLFSNTGQEPTIFSKRTADNREVSGVLFVEADGRFTFASRALDSQGRDWVESTTPAGGTVGNDGQFTHLAVTCSGPTLKFYRNGVLVHTTTHPARPATEAPLTIGGGSVGGNVVGDFDGYIDELSVYTRALTGTEIGSIVAADTLGKVIRVKPAITSEVFPLQGGQLSLEGGTQPWNVTVFAGTLPVGISVSSNGLVTGTASNGAYSFTLQVTDAAGKYTERVFSGLVQNPIPAPEGLVAWWPGEEAVTEVINGDHVGVSSGSPAYGFGKVGRAFTFNGTSQSLQTPQATGVLNEPEMTIEAWIKPELRSDGVANDLFPANVICNDKQNFGGVGIGANVFAGGSSLWLELQTEDPADAHHRVPGAALTAGQWHHVALVLTPGNARTYLDGVLLESFDFEQGDFDADATVRIGRHNDDAGFGSRRFFKGSIDEVSVYHRPLAGPEVASLYHAGAAGKLRYDASRDFVFTPNPSSPRQNADAVWTYGSLPAGPIDLTNFILADSFVTSGPLQTWFAGGGGDQANVSRNGGNTTFNPNGAGGTEIRWAPRQLSMGPSSGNYYGVVRWKAPVTGRYAVSASFKGIDAHGVTTDVHVYHNSDPLYNDVVANEFLGNGHSYTGTIEAEAEDVVSFLVGPNGNYSFDNTGVTAHVVFLGSSISPATDLQVLTAAPPTNGRQWFFTANHPNDIEGLSLRVQYAEANTPDTWADLAVDESTNAMSPPDSEEHPWTLVVSPLELPAGNYYFRVVASAPGLGDKLSAVFGAEALGEGGSGAIAISDPGEPPPLPPLDLMPGTSKLLVKVIDADPRTSPTKTVSTKQGAILDFTAAQPIPFGTIVETVRIQYSTTPANPASWTNLDNGKLDPISASKSGKVFHDTSENIPVGVGIYFRTLTSGPGRASAAGPLVKGVVTPVGPYNIAPGPIWRFVDIAHTNKSNTADSDGYFAYVGEEIRYTMEFENEGDAPATDVLATLRAPTGTQLLSYDATDVTKATGSKVDWAFPSLPAGQKIVKYIQVKVTGKPGTIVVMPLANATVKCDEIPSRQAKPSLRQSYIREGIKTLLTHVTSPLRLVLKSNPSVAAAGETVDYELIASNEAGDAMIAPEVTFRVPYGMCVEYLRLADGNGNFTSTQFPNPSPSSNPSLEPYQLGGRQLIRWQLDDMPAKSQRRMKFTLRVQFDLPSYYTSGGVSHTTSLAADSYSLSATNAQGTKFVAFKKSPPTVSTLVSGEQPPTPSPQLSLVKTAKSDGKLAGDAISNAAELYSLQMPGIGEVSTAFQNSRIIYTLRYANAAGAGAGRNVTIRDRVPEGTTFIGWIRRNGTLVDSSFGFTFRNKEGLIIPSGGEPLNDTNLNGVRDSGETYTDTNKNGRHDAFTDTKFFEINVGMLAGGSSGEISYEVAATSNPGTLILSHSGGALIPKRNRSKLYDGFSIISENLLLPVAGNPNLLASVVVTPASLEVQPVAINTSGLFPGGSISFDIPYRVNGADGLQFENMALKLEIPKHYNLDASKTGYVNTSANVPEGTLQPLRAPFVGESPAQVGSPNPAGARLLTFPLGNLPGLDSNNNVQPGLGREGVIRVTLTVDNPLPGELLDEHGYVKLPLHVRPELNGNAKSGLSIARAGRHAVNAPLSTPLPSASTLVAVPVFSPSQAEIFVGRIAPVSVQKGETFTVTLFFGNHTNRHATGGVVAMQIPYGTDFVSATISTIIGPEGNEDERIDNPLGLTGKGPKAYERNKGVILWNVLDLPPNFAGAATLTLKVRDDFSGSKIEDVSCYGKWTNAFAKVPPKMTVHVRQTNFLSPLADAVGGFFTNLFGAFPPAVQQALAGNPLNGNSRQIGVGGAGFVHLTNGSIVVPLLGSRVLVAGPSSLVEASDFNVLTDDGSARVAVGHQYTPGFRITGIQNPGATIWTPGDIIAGLRQQGTSLVAAGAGNLVAAGGGNLVAAGGGNLVDNASGASLNIQLRPKNANLVAAGGLNLVAAGGGNLVAAGGGNLVAAGAGNMVAAGAGNLVGMDGGSLVAAGGGNLVAAGAGNLVAAGGLNLLANDMPKLVGMDGGSLVAAGGLNMTAKQLAGAQLVAAGAGNVLSHNGGTLVAAGGLNLVAAGGLNLVAAGGGNLVAAGGLNLVAAGAGNLVAAGGLNLVAAGGGN